MTLSMAGRDLARVVRGLYLTAMVVFLVTIGIGILNGADAVDFNRDQILTHVHSGTLGWISLSIVAASAWFARGIDPRLAISVGVVIPIYVLAFYLGNPTLRAIVGAVLLLVIVWLVVWAWRVATARGSLPALAIALGLTTFTYGAIIGVLRQVQLAGGPSLPGDVVGAHAAAMTFSYLILTAMGLLEWRILGTTSRPRGGLAQILLLFAGGALISFTLLFLPASALQPVGGLYLLVELVAVILFAIRVLPRAVRIDWAGDAAGRHLAAASLFVVAATAIFLVVVAIVISNPNLSATDPSIVGIVIASDHAVFIGVITNLTLGLLFVLTADRPARWSWAPPAAFWAVNVGLVVFLVGLIAQQVLLKRIGAPLMGVALLFGLAILADRLRSSTLRAATDD
jgi:energy-converting hydrogenase Eha subunit A